MTPAMEPDAYMEAFMNGFEFVLLAIRGRLAEEDLTDEERARLQLFLQDYARIARAYRERRAAAPVEGIAIQGRIPSDPTLVAVN